MPRVAGDTGAAEPVGVTHTRARERRARLDSLLCDLHLVIPADPAAPIAGSLSIAFQLRPSSAPLVVDFAPAATHLRRTRVNGRTAAPIVDNGHIVIARETLTSGANHLAFDFIAGDTSLTRRDGLVYSLFVPARASHAFPCFDQPDLKARWRLSLEIPADWQAVSNTHVTSRSVTNEWQHVEFDRTEPLPTYLVAFAAGRFDIASPATDGRPIRVFHLGPDADRVRRNQSEVVVRHQDAVAWLEAYTDIPYPFGKIDIVAIPSFQFTGMEHPGAIFYDADALLLDDSATPEAHTRRADVIAHETAHMWFGNLVTMPWFDDVWLKEVMASFMAARITGSAGTAEDDVRFFVQHYGPAHRADRARGALPVRQALDNLDEAGLVYGAGLYHKAPIALRQLEHLIGEGPLREALRSWLSQHRFGNAGWTELSTELIGRTEIDIATWGHSWIESAGRPVLAVRQVTTAEGPQLVVTQRDERGRALFWPQDVDVVCGSGNRVEHVTARLTGGQTVVPTSDSEWEWVLPAGRCQAYGRVALDAASLDRLLETTDAIADARIRAAAFQATWEAMLERRVDSARVFAARLEALAVEPDVNVQQLLTGQIRRLLWLWIPDEARVEAAGALEAIVRSRLEHAASTREKAAWFALLQQVALRPPTVEWLRAVFNGETAVDGLLLDDGDVVRLAAELSLRLPHRWAPILDAARERCESPHQRERLRFIAPAISPDPSTREEFFEVLRTAGSEHPEAWIVEALGWLHHPLRAASSIPLIAPALARLPEIQHTGSVFFPQRWAAAVLAWHGSRDAARVVVDFVRSLPASYSPRLRAVILGAADDLLRAARGT